MTLQRIAGVALLALLAGTPSVSAQEVRGFASAGITTESNDQQYPAFGGGLTVALGQPWVSAGAQGETFVSWPYISGRGAVFGQGNLMPKGLVRPFVLAGYGIAEYSGPMFGAGVEFRPPNQRIGFRVAVEDYLVSPGRFSGTTTNHHVSFRAGIVF